MISDLPSLNLNWISILLPTDQPDDGREDKPSYLLSDPALYQACVPALKTIEEVLAKTSIADFCSGVKQEHFPNSEFVGSYEEAGLTIGVLVEQWPHQRRELIKGRVLNMSGVQHWFSFVYELETVKEVVVSDYSEAEVEKFGYRTKVDVIGDFSAETLPMEAESLDTILCLSVLEHCDDPFQMIINLGQLLRPGGYLFVECPFAYIDGHLDPDNWRFCRDGYRLLAKKAQLDLVETGQYGNYASFTSMLYGLPVGTETDRGIPWINWMVCQKPS
ncbi:MAG: class I SAM-dependent methyltransferase [Rhodospirillaceae bacterium]|nr:class I SAM-dependent methyltransferase [Rhodospirillaceae bacterium]